MNIFNVTKSETNILTNKDIVNKYNKLSQKHKSESKSNDEKELSSYRLLDIDTTEQVKIVSKRSEMYETQTDKSDFEKHKKEFDNFMERKETEHYVDTSKSVMDKFNAMLEERKIEITPQSGFSHYTNELDETNKQNKSKNNTNQSNSTSKSNEFTFSIKYNDAEYNDKQNKFLIAFNKYINDF